MALGHWHGDQLVWNLGHCPVLTMWRGGGEGAAVHIEVPSAVRARALCPVRCPPCLHSVAF